MRQCSVRVERWWRGGGGGGGGCGCGWRPDVRWKGRYGEWRRQGGRGKNREGWKARG